MDMKELQLNVSNGINGEKNGASIAGISNENKKPINLSLKAQTDLCNCPLRCGDKVQKHKRELLHKEFQKLESHSMQNKYLRKYIKIRSVNKRLWEDEIIDGKMQRRVTCKYLVPDFEIKQGENSDTKCCDKSGYVVKQNGNISSEMMDDYPSENNKLNGSQDDGCNLSTDSSSDSESDESNDFFEDTLAYRKFLLSGKYIEICQKAFINIYGVTEKRIRYQRERLIIKSRFMAEKKQKQSEEMERTLSIARNLGAGCQPLFALLEKTNASHLSEQILKAIEKDIILVNNFFQNQLWKPEDINFQMKNAPGAASSATPVVAADKPSDMNGIKQ